MAGDFKRRINLDQSFATCHENRPMKSPVMKYTTNNMADINIYQEDNDDDSQKVWGIDDLEVLEGGLSDTDSQLTPVERLEKYMQSDNVFNRQMVARGLLDTLRDVGDVESDCAAVLQAMMKLSRDPEATVRSELMEQVPHMAMYCQQHREVFKNAVPNYLLPLVVKYLDDGNNQVRKTSQAALLVLLEQELVEKCDIEEQVVEMIVELAGPESPDDYRTEAVALMSKLAPLLGREVTVKQFLPRFCEMCQDQLFHVKKVCAANFGDICTVVGTDNSEKFLLSHFIELCNDRVWGVRKACTECFMTVSQICTSAHSKSELTHNFVNLLRDQSRWVRMAAFQALGPVISTFCNSGLTGLTIDDEGMVTYTQPESLSSPEETHQEANRTTAEMPEKDDSYEREKEDSFDDSEDDIIVNCDLNVITDCDNDDDEQSSDNTRSDNTTQDYTQLTDTNIDPSSDICENSNSETSDSGIDDYSGLDVLCTNYDITPSLSNMKLITDDNHVNNNATHDISNSNTTIIETNLELQKPPSESTRSQSELEKPPSEFSTDFSNSALEETDRLLADLEQSAGESLEVKTGDDAKNTPRAPEVTGSGDDKLTQATNQPTDTLDHQNNLLETSDVPNRSSKETLDDAKDSTDLRYGLQNDPSDLRNYPSGLQNDPSRPSNLRNDPSNPLNDPTEQVDPTDEVFHPPNSLMSRQSSMASSASDISSVTSDEDGKVHIHIDNSPTFNTFPFWRSPIPEVGVDMDIVNGMPTNIVIKATVQDQEHNKVYQTEMDVHVSRDDDLSVSNATMNDVISSLTSPDETISTTIATTPIVDTSPTSEVVSTIHPEVTMVRQSSEVAATGVKVHTASVSTVSEFDMVPNIGSTHILGQRVRTFSSLDVSSNNISFIDSDHPISPGSLAHVNDADLSHLQNVIPASLLENYLSMANPSQAEWVDQEITRHCAYSLPAVAFTLGRSNWTCVKRLYGELVGDIQWKVRRTLAFSLHGLAIILGEDITHCDLVPVFEGFLKDLDEVRIGVLKHLADFLQLLRPPVRKLYLTRVQDFLTTDNQRNWRFRLELAEQLVTMCTLFDCESIHDHLLPVSHVLFVDKVSCVRLKACELTAHIVKRLMEHSPEQHQHTLSNLHIKYANSHTWSHRQQYTHMCEAILRLGAVTEMQFSQMYLVTMLSLGTDSIPNIRISLAKTVSQYLTNSDFFTSAKNPHHELLLDTAKALQCDPDNDVRHFFTNSQTSYDVPV